MILQPVDNQPGLWTNPAWQPGDPGTFAVLIGVSAYPYLEGGTAQSVADENYGLGQLGVSALTAYRLFEWLHKQYLYTPAQEPPCTLAKCWLLLSPTIDEKALIPPDVLAHMLDPTFANCRQALRAWYSTMKKLPDDQAHLSRAVFFFSGHGLQVSHEEQILLPADYLNPNGGSLNDALNMADACLSLRELAIDNQFIFLDACRNDTSKLREQVIHGDGVLDQALAFRSNPNCNQLLMYAAAAGQQTFGPRTPDKGLSLFGQSLVSGLKAERNFALNRQQKPYAVQWFPLHEYVRTTYNELLKFYKTTLTQKVIAAGNIIDFNAVVTHIDPRVIHREKWRIDTSRDGLEEYTTQADHETSDLEDNSGTDQGYTYPGQYIDHDISFDPSLPTLTYQTYWAPLPGHDLFGRETVTAMWEGARLYQLDASSVSTDAIAERPFLQKVQRTADNIGYKITFALSAPGLYWLELADSQTTYALILPYFPTMFTGIHFLVEFSLADQSQQLIIEGVQCGLSPDDDSFGEAARLWQKYDQAGGFKTAAEMEVNFLNALVQGKIANPMGALIAAIILVRIGHIGKLPRQWLENMVNWFPEYADTPVLWNEYLLQQPASPDQDDDARRSAYQNRIEGCLRTMHERGLPVTGEVLSYAIRQATNLLAIKPSITADSSASIAYTYETLQLARQYFLPDGLFAVFAGHPDKLAQLRSQWYARG